MTSKKEINIDEQIEKANKAKERLERKIETLNAKKKESMIKNRMDLLEILLNDNSIVDFLKNKDSVNKSLLQEVLNEFEK